MPEYIHALQGNGDMLLLRRRKKTKGKRHDTYFAPDARPNSRQPMITQNWRLGIFASRVELPIKDDARTANFSPAQ